MNIIIVMKKVFCTIISIILAASALAGCSAAPDQNRASDTRFLLDTVCTVSVSGENAESAVSEVFDLISEIADEIDYYDPGSSVSKFNSAPAGEAVPLSESCAGIIAAALDVSAASGGAFDITIAPVKDLWDFNLVIKPI